MPPSIVRGDPPARRAPARGGVGLRRTTQQHVVRSWEVTADPLRQYLAQCGATVVLIDSRGSDARGVAFESVIQGRLGWNEVADQAAAVRQLIQRGVLRDGAVGIYGGSYGGFMTLMAMAREPELFGVGVATSSVTDWAGTTPPTPNATSGPRPPTPRRTGDRPPSRAPRRCAAACSLMHGTSDENVLMRNSTRLVEAFRSAGREVELVPLSGQRHRARGSAIHMRDARTAAHLLRGLGLPFPEELGPS